MQIEFSASEDGGMLADFTLQVVNFLVQKEVFQYNVQVSF